MTDQSPKTPGEVEQFREELLRCWRAMPGKALFFALLAAWVALFHFLGNSTLGYKNTSSLFGWMEYAYSMSQDDAHGRLIPFVVLALLWWKRAELLAAPKRNWWPAITMLFVAILIHIVGYMVQQARISIVALFVGLYALLGMVWGPRFLLVTFFPIFLFGFCLPVGTLAETITFPLRLVATNITAMFSHGALGINVIQDGTRIFDANGTYQYEIAAACSGIRSLTATFAIAIIYAFVMFKTGWRRLVMTAAAVPLAVAANVLRLTTIIVAAEAFGQKAGNFVHENSWLSLMPYVPAIGGILLIGHWLRENKRPRVPNRQPALAGAKQEL